MTYSGDTIINNLRSITWPTSAGSVYITMSEQAPFGYVLGYNSKLDFAADIYLRELWTWMFYDTNAPINLSNNEIAGSATFSFQDPLYLRPPLQRQVQRRLHSCLRSSL
jgi:hypothetical protein